MASIIIIPIIIVAIIGLSGYLVYRFLIYDLMCKRTVKQILQKYNIKKTPSQIIREYYTNKGEEISYKEIQDIEKNYRQNEPEQFLAMYDAIRNNKDNSEKE
ncbi:MAG: hypothetical protein OEM18_05365 [Nitrosopumilus sp.]|nr:hypothetical protein [Nitrosopumilus sp.]MDH3501409.1 hypothetical protein [Nitrosopumilus sp.]